MCTSHTTIVHAFVPTPATWFPKILKLKLLYFLPLQVKKNPWLVGQTMRLKKNKLTVDSINFFQQIHHLQTWTQWLFLVPINAWLYATYRPWMEPGNSIDESSELLFKFSDRLLPNAQLSPLAEFFQQHKLTPQTNGSANPMGCFFKEEIPWKQWPFRTSPLFLIRVESQRGNASYSNHPFSGDIFLCFRKIVLFVRRNFLKKTILRYLKKSSGQKGFQLCHFGHSLRSVEVACLLRFLPHGSQKWVPAIGAVPSIQPFSHFHD